jgi:hypothetical protein
MDGPRTRTIIFFGWVPVIIKPPMSDLAWPIGPRVEIWPRRERDVLSVEPALACFIEANATAEVRTNARHVRSEVFIVGKI